MAFGVVEHLVHDLNEPGGGDDIGLPLSILPCQREKEPFLIVKMMEDRATGFPRRFLESSYGGSLVAVVAETTACTVEDFCSAIVEVFF